MVVRGVLLLALGMGVGQAEGEELGLALGG